ncbi:MAG TPA: hypothetical protein VHN79_06660 [Lacunisphaera sp.]|nr:hypothetical protein [Lacunisphaera sp.]
MKPSSRLTARTVLAFSCMTCLALTSAPALHATNADTRPLADKEPVLPLTPTFEKGESTEGTPFVLQLKNESKATLKVSGKVLLAVVHHAMDKARALPEQSVAPGQTLTIKDLSADDRVFLSSPGFAPLEVRVPFKL